MKKTLYCLLILLLPVFIVQPVASAQEIGVSPATHNEAVSSWCPSSYEIEVVNRSSDETDVEVTYKDVPTRLLAMGAAQDAKTGISEWLTISESQLLLTADEKRSVRVDIHPPEGVSSGNYYGIVAFTDQKLSTVRAIDHIVNLELNNDLLPASEALRSSDVIISDHSFFKHSGTAESVRVNDTKMAADISAPSILKITNMFGSVVAQVEAELSTGEVLCPGEVLSESFNWSLSPLAVGMYTFNISDINDAQENKTAKVFILSPVALVLFILAIISVLILRRRF